MTNEDVPNVRRLRLTYAVEANPLPTPLAAPISLPSKPLNRTDSVATIVPAPPTPFRTVTEPDYFAIPAERQPRPNPTSPGGAYEHLVCPLCFTLPPRIKRLPCCGNKICADCGRMWIKEHGTCPFCRADLNQVLNGSKHASEGQVVSVVENVDAAGQVEELRVQNQQPDAPQEADITDMAVPGRNIRLPDDEEAQAMLDQIDVLCPFRETVPGMNWKGGCKWVGPRKCVKKHLSEECIGIMDPTTGQKVLDVFSIIIVGMDDSDSDYEEDEHPDHAVIQIDDDGRALAMYLQGREAQMMSAGGFIVEDDDPRQYRRKVWRRWLCVLFGFGLLGGFIAYLIAGNASDARANARFNNQPTVVGS